MPDSRLIECITSSDPHTRNQSLDELCAPLSLDALVRECAALDAFRRTCPNMFERVRAMAFLYAIYRFHVPQRLGTSAPGHIPYGGYTHLL